jgi:nickel/cobalt exporter
MLWRVREDARRVMLAADQAHGRGHHHAQDDVQVIDTGHGAIKVEVSEDGVPPRWRVQTLSGHRWQAEDVTIAIERPSGATELFTFRDAGAYLESRDAIAEPHEFTARVRLSHGDHAHDYDLSFVESDVVPHGHALTASSVTQFTGHQNAHELAHAHDIRRRFTNRNVTTGQIVVFGLTGGLIPCPAAITVLLLCLQLKEVTLGAVLVLSFSVGLALTLVAVGVAAALSVRHVGPRLPWLSMLVQRAPYVSGVLILIVGVYIGLHGFYSLQGH